MSDGDRPQLPLALANTQLAAPAAERFGGRYRVEASLGEGGTGHVYRARHVALDRPVALKVLRRPHDAARVSRRRFEREARALGQLVHPNVVAVTDSGMDEGGPFLVMELLNGQDLARRLRSGALPVAVACRYALEMLDGLAFVHERGLVHRDIKPGNLFLENTAAGERVKLLDFGLARLVTPSTDAAVTRVGEVLGTPVYMAPEQVSGAAADARTDVYAAGLVLYEMLAGKRAFEGNDMAVLYRRLVEPVPRLSHPELAPLDGVIQRATHREPAGRFADAGAMREALAEAAARLTPDAASPSATARGPRRPVPRPRPPARDTGGVMRAGAVLVSCVALTAILIACCVIYLIESPGGQARRALLQRVLFSASDATEAPR